LVEALVNAREGSWARCVLWNVEKDGRDEQLSFPAKRDESVYFIHFFSNIIVSTFHLFLPSIVILLHRVSQFAKVSNPDQVRFFSASETLLSLSQLSLIHCKSDASQETKTIDSTRNSASKVSDSHLVLSVFISSHLFRSV